MPKLKPFLFEVKDLYRSSFEDISLFSYYMGIKDCLPTITDDRITEMWLRKMNLSEDEFPHKTACQVLFNMKKRYLKNC
jgi:hypothetical protein